MDLLTFQSIRDTDGQFIIFIGHYNVPDFSDTRLLLNGRLESQTKLLTDASKQDEKVTENSEVKKNDLSTNSVGVQTEFESEETEQIIITYANQTNLGEMVHNAYSSVKVFINLEENKGLKLTLIILVGCIIAMFWYLQMQVSVLAAMCRE